jgi:hypothetical protein
VSATDKSTHENGNGHGPITEPRPLHGIPPEALAADMSLVVELTAGKVDELISEAHAAALWRDTAMKWMMQAEARLVRIERGVKDILDALRSP